MNNKASVNLQELFSAGIQPMKLLLTGDPGSSKSYIIERIFELAKIMKLDFVGITSYNGMAAANVDGKTVCSMFSIGNTSEDN